jgi:histidine triad (HIT) family protein
MEEEKTLFEKIIDRELPVDFVYEDEKHSAFLTIEPDNKGHVLVVPKKPYRWFYDMPEDEYCDLQKVCRRLVPAIKKATKADFVILKIVGEEIPHVHIHLIPVFESDPPIEIPKHYYDSPKEKAKYAEDIAGAL